MESKEKNTKEKILEEALKLFAQSGYMGTSMNEIASRLGVTKAALYKHYSIKQEILDSIVERMNQMDVKRAKEYEMPDGDIIRHFKRLVLLLTAEEIDTKRDSQQNRKHHAVDTNHCRLNSVH